VVEISNGGSGEVVGIIAGATKSVGNDVGNDVCEVVGVTESEEEEFEEVDAVGVTDGV